MKTLSSTNPNKTTPTAQANTRTNTRTRPKETPNNTNTKSSKTLGSLNKSSYQEAVCEVETHQYTQNLTSANQTEIDKIKPISIQEEIEEELQFLQSINQQKQERNKNGRWMGPYIRVNGLLKAEQPDIPLEGGGTTRHTSFAAIFPSSKPNTVIVEIDVEELMKVQKSDEGGYYGVGHLTNGMTMEAIGEKSMALMAPSSNGLAWRRIGTIINQRGENKRSVIKIRPGVKLPIANERGRIRCVGRNYLNNTSLEKSMNELD